jgi:divalent metal cation (Fe/Co/Zn/Cd) transporter
MSNKDGYKKQKNLSFIQFLAETPSFIAVLVSAILSKTILVFVDLLDSFGNILRTAMVTILSKKLSKDLRFEYNYGVGKIEVIASLICDGIVFFGLLSTVGLSVYSIIFPEQPSDLVIGVVGLKVINVSFDTAFFVKQRKILKTHRSAISETNYAAALAALLFDSVTLVSLLVMWLLRNNTIGGYISPVISIFVAIYLMYGCIKRTKRALDELTDKTLPEEEQMKILNILTRYYSSYSQFHSINSHKSGDVTRIDIHLSFEQNTTFEEIMTLKKQMQEELDRLFGNCIANIVVGEDRTIYCE